MSVSPFVLPSVRMSPNLLNLDKTRKNLTSTKLTKQAHQQVESKKNCLPSRSCLFPTVRHGVRWGWGGTGCNRASWGSPRLAWISKSIKHQLDQKEALTLHTENKFKFRQPASSWAYQTLCVILWSRSASQCPEVIKRMCNVITHVMIIAQRM